MKSALYTLRRKAKDLRRRVELHFKGNKILSQETLTLVREQYYEHQKAIYRISPVTESEEIKEVVQVYDTDQRESLKELKAQMPKTCRECRLTEICDHKNKHYAGVTCLTYLYGTHATL